MLHRILICLFLLFGCFYATPLAPSDLKLEYMPSPVIGSDVLRPRFSWVLSNTERGQAQTSYQVQVSSSPSVPTGDIWDSGKVTSDKSNLVKYPSTATALKSDTTYFWKVRYTDKSGEQSLWSEVARFDTGLFSESDWSGSWIGGDSALRTEFSLPSAVKRARLYICGLGYYVARLNGKKIGDTVLGSFTTFQKEVLYDVHDITNMLSFDNALAITLGHGWYAQPSVKAGGESLRAFISATLLDGSKKVYAATDTSSWKAASSPVTLDDIYIGENFDARMEHEGWDLPRYNTTGWKPAGTVPAPQGELRAMMMPPIKVMDSYTPVKITEPSPGTFVFDFGQNMAGFCTLKVQGPRGTVVKLQHAELLFPNGSVHHLYRNSPEIDTYTLKGGSLETFTPMFTYHGFRYVSVTGFPGVPNLDSLEAHFVHTALDEIGEVVFSNELLNKIQHITRFASLSNYMNIPTDCPQRERRGWLGDAQLSAETLLHNWDMGAAYTKFIRDIRNEQLFENRNGNVPDCVPYYHHGGDPADPAWGVAYTLIPWWMYQYYGDVDILEEFFTGIYDHVMALHDVSDNSTGLLLWSRYGDWCGAVPGMNGCKYSSNLVSSFYYLMQLDLVGEMAGIVGKPAEQKVLLNLAAKARKSFNPHFYKPSNSTYEFGWQTSQALPLWYDLVGNNEKKGVVDYLLSDISKNKDHLTTGIVGTKYLLPTLDMINRTDIAYTIATQTTEPSWGWMIMNGATTLWENWKGDQYHNVGSRNHIMFGSQSDWYYKSLAGIQMAKGSIAFKKLNIAPNVNGLTSTDLTSVSASMRTHRGLIVSSWQLAKNTKHTCASVPENSEMKLTCPGGLFENVEFASFGTPTGTCGNFSKSSCDATDTTEIIAKACIGKSSCSIMASDSVFKDPCHDVVKHLDVQLSGSCKQSIFDHSVTIPVGSTATVSLPKVGLTSVTIQEGSSNIWSGYKYVPGVKGITGAMDKGGVIDVLVGSGEYHFSVYSV